MAFKQVGYGLRLDNSAAPDAPPPALRVARVPAAAMGLTERQQLATALRESRAAAAGLEPEVEPLLFAPATVAPPPAAEAPEARKLTRSEKELASLAPWAWDPNLARHAPGRAFLRDFSEVVCDKNLGPKMRLMLAGGERAPHDASPPLRAARQAHAAVSPGSGLPAPRPSVKRPRSATHGGEGGVAKRTTPPPGVGMAGTPIPRTAPPVGEPRAKAPRRASPSGTATGARPASAGGAARGRVPPASPVPWRGFEAAAAADVFASPAPGNAARARGRASGVSGIEALAAAAGAWSSGGSESDEGGARPGAKAVTPASRGKENTAPPAFASPPPPPPAAKRVSGAGGVFWAHAAAAEEQRRLSAAYAAELAKLRAYAALPPLPPGRDSARHAPSDPALAARRRAPIGYVVPPPGARSAAGFPGIAAPMQATRPLGVSPAMSAGLARLRAAAAAHVAAVKNAAAPTAAPAAVAAQ